MAIFNSYVKFPEGNSCGAKVFLQELASKIATAEAGPVQ
jgi:hypothetical protein